MNSSDLKTRENILKAGKEEFLLKGFLGASLRNIVKDAGVTTGAFYGYFKSKEQLFDDLVSEQEQCFFDKFNEAQDTFAKLPPEQQPENMGVISGECISWLIEYMYDNSDAFKLLLCCSEGTKHANFIHTLVEIEIDSTHRFVSILNKLGYKMKMIDVRLEHMLVSGMFSALFEIIIHNMPKEEGIRFVDDMIKFYTAGWQKIMGL